MNDKPIIIAGLIVVLVVLTSPIWYSLAAGEPGDRPELVLPSGMTECVEDTEYMRGQHMDLLNTWRNEVVRDGDTSMYKSKLGKEYEKSLTKTCLMQCHLNEQIGKEDFCGKCHEFAGVHPTCWDCHVENPKPNGE